MEEEHKMNEVHLDMLIKDAEGLTHPLTLMWADVEAMPAAETDNTHAETHIKFAQGSLKAYTRRILQAMLDELDKETD